MQDKGGWNINLHPHCPIAENFDTPGIEYITLRFRGPHDKHGGGGANNPDTTSCPVCLVEA